MPAVAQNISYPIGGTQQSELITVAVNGTTVGIFDTYTGGDVAAPSTKFRSGGQFFETSYQTLPKFSDITVGRVLDLNVSWDFIRNTIPLCGRVPASVTLQPLDADLNNYGNSRTATGLLLGIKGIRVDSNSETIQDFQMDIAVDGWQ
jgi:hypothetical protein